jgi:alanyl-tRNA synthetase
MNSKEIKEKFLDFFKEKRHTEVPSSSLISDDPSVLFTTAGMQQFKPYYLGEKSPYGNKAVSIQKCFRTSDIDSVGDESHLTFFEMLGNFSFGDYFKKEAIKYAYEFITKELGLKIDFVSVFEGDPQNNIPPDEESEKIWKEIAPEIEIKKLGKKDNFWGPTGVEGPCGPTTEIYIRGVEIWNLVFNEYYRDKNGKFTKLKTPGVDTGMGLERLAMVSQKVPTIFETDLFNLSLLSEEFSGRVKRIILDHSRAIAFLINDGLRPSNKEAGYILRRLMRRIIVYANTELAIRAVIKNYPELKEGIILPVFQEEKSRFSETINAGLRELNKIPVIDAKSAFKFYESYGLPYEIIKELGGAKTINLNREDFDKEFAKHQELSRTASAGMFKSGLVDTNEQTIKYHTATHLLLAALRQILGDQVFQKGSNITSERLRLDFSHPGKLTPEQIKKIEDMVNQKIKENLPVEMKEMNLEEAKKQDAVGVFESKYGEKVKVYNIGNFSKEICAGPHVKNTAEIGQFKILKEEPISAGVRRIRAIVE